MLAWILVVTYSHKEFFDIENHSFIHLLYVSLRIASAFKAENIHIIAFY